MTRMRELLAIACLCFCCSSLCFAQQSGHVPAGQEAPKDDLPPRFSIGLGVLAPSYSQKFGDDGKIKLDYNQEKGGYSYSLSNLVHPALTALKASEKSDVQK